MPLILKCPQCNTNMKFERVPSDGSIAAVCPSCSTRIHPCEQADAAIDGRTDRTCPHCKGLCIVNKADLSLWCLNRCPTSGGGKVGQL